MESKLELLPKILDWAKEKGIFDKGTRERQFQKTLEEVDELRVALTDDDLDEIKDAIGDITVTLIIQAEMNGLDFMECLESAYNVISERTGKMVDGTFVKDK